MPDDRPLQRGSRSPATDATATCPSSHPRLIDRYEEIARASRRMCDAACAENWEAVHRIEARCRRLIGRLASAHLTERLSAEEDRRRIALLRGILADDAKIRERTEPWLRQIERLLEPPPAAPARIGRPAPSASPLPPGRAPDGHGPPDAG